MHSAINSDFPSRHLPLTVYEIIKQSNIFFFFFISSLLVKKETNIKNQWKL